MKFDISSIQFSFVDKKKRIRLPSELGKKLANFIGIHLGDGNIHINPKKYENQINCTGHLFDEHQWYLDYLIPLVKDLFNVSPYLYKDKRLNNSSIKITYRSKAIVGFLVNVLGLPPGKKDKWGIPFCIKRAPIELKREFLKGFGDTDFSLSFSKRNKGLHKYPTISLGTFSYAKKVAIYGDSDQSNNGVG